MFTVVSGLTGRLSCMGVPPSLTILAFFLWSRLSWFFFIRAISSSSLGFVFKKVNINVPLNRKRKYLFLARLSLSASPVGANESASVASSSRAWRPRTYALITAGSRIISVCQSPSTLLSSVFPVSGHNVKGLTSRLILKTLLLPSGPMLPSRSRSIDEPLLTGGGGVG